MDYSIAAYCFLLAAGFLAGVVNTLAGGGSVFTLSVLIFFGMPIGLANGTNRLGILAQNFAGAYAFHQNGLLRLKGSLRFVLPALAGAVVGALAAVDIDQDVMEVVIGLLMTGVLFLVLFNPKHKYRIGSQAQRLPAWLNALIFFAIGFYGGFVQAGIGIVILVALFRGANFTLMRGNALKMLIIFLYTLPVCAIFAFNGQISWGPAIVLALGQMAGTWFTERYAVRHPKANIWVRWVLIAMIAVSILKSFRKSFKYLEQWLNELTMQVDEMVQWIASLLSGEAQQWVVLAILAFIIASLLREWLRPAMIFLLASVALIMFNVVKPEEWLGAFANKQIATIMLLVVITSALQKNFNVERVLDAAFRHARSGRAFLWRMCVYVAAFSSFLNNTPVVAFMTPYVYNWSKRLGIHPSKLLIPLSYATILGGMITLLGTSTNLVLNGFLEENDVTPLGFKDFFFLGILVTAGGILYLYTLGYSLLPENREAFDDFREKAPEYTAELHVTETAKAIGRTVQEAGLMSLKGAYLIEIIRSGAHLPMVSPQEVLKGGDVLIFIGKTDAIIDLASSDQGLRLPSQEEDGHEIVEVVVPANSALAGHYISNERLKSQYDAKVVAMHRNGEKIKGKIEQVKLSHGDLLLLSVGESFIRNLDSLTDFYVLSRIDRGTTAQSKHVNIFLGLLSLILLATFLKVIGMFTALVFILSAMLLLNMYSFKEMKRVIDVDLVVVLASALTIGTAVIRTGAADLVARHFMNLLEPFGVVALLTGLFAITVALTSFVTNVAAVSIMFPIAYSICQQLGIDGTPFYVVLAFGASAAFLTPVGYQTNWMVYGPGGYTPKDFLRVGFPLLLLYGTTCIVFCVFYYDML
jgi:di/tricarboxylate transporter/uncharacterized membrane protein YfcA